MIGANTRPEKEVRAGAVRVAVWTNERRNRDGESFDSHRVQLERTYKDAQGNFKTTQSLELNDIPKAILALSKAYEFLTLKGEGTDGRSEIEDAFGSVRG